MLVLQSKYGWPYIVVGALSFLLMACVAAVNTRDPLWGAMLGVVGFAFYVVLFEAAQRVERVYSRLAKRLAWGVVAALCIMVIVGVSEAVTSGRFDLLPSRPALWLAPISTLLATLIAVMRRRTQAPDH